MLQKYADIIIDISHEAIDRAFQYKIPEELINKVETGSYVEVPFGKGNAIRKGYVIGISDVPKWDEDKIKEIKGVPDEGIPIEGKLIRLAAWLKDTYGSTMINALKTVMPVKERVAKKKPQKDLSEFKLDIEKVVSLNSEQKKITDEFTENLIHGVNRVYLLKGVTGSGKTEVYIETIKQTVKQGGQAIMLVPEIALTYQTVSRFKMHFGDRVSVINSQMSKGERYRELMKARNGETDVVIGPRSALFTPFTRLRLIIIDEEHDSAYKSDNSPKYHARDTAIERARLEGASVILGSATPSIESYAMAKLGKYRLWELKERAGGGQLSDVKMIDMREELKLGNRSIISQELYDRMDEAFKNGEQVMLFINRRGYNSCVSCRSCGHAVKCPKCDVALSLHRNGFLMCHYCGHIERQPKKCPECGSNLIGGYGTGTEKVKEAVEKFFPNVKTLIMDRDTTLKKGAHGEIITAFSKKEADCLVGTQMIVKGHDFPNVTVVGIMLADLTLFENDYRAAERTFDLITQAAGRAGRSEKRGCTVIQTYQPEHYAIAAAAEQDYEKFFEMEMSYRQILKYPPVYHMMLVLITSKDEETVNEAAKFTAGLLREVMKDSDTGSVIGPGEAAISKINDVYRRVVYVKNLKYNILVKAKEYTEKKVQEKYPVGDVSLSFDFNPVNMY